MIQTTNDLERKNRERLSVALAERLKRCTSRMESSSLLLWTIQRRPSLSVDRPFDLTHHPYLIDIYADPAQVMVLYKASQMGASEYGVSYALQAADERGATVLYIFPTDTHVSDFSSARIGPAIEASPYLDSIVVEGGTDGKRGADRVTLKRIRNRFLYLRGGQVKPNGQAPQLKSIDADVIILDEVDEMDARAPAIAEKRLGHSKLAEQRWISTPTYTGVGIHAKWMESDQRQWFVRCEHCGEKQPLTIQQVVYEWDELGRPVKWSEHVRCTKCSKALNRLARGEWVAEWPDRVIRGYHLTKLFSPTAKMVDIVKALMTTDETKRREAYNQDLGLPYTPRGGQITDQILDELRREYAHKPVQYEPTVAGVDVNKLLNVVIRGPEHPETGERPQRFAGEVDSFEALQRLFKAYNVQACVVDALPETRKAREFQEKFPAGVVWLAYYVTQKIGTKRGEPAEWDADRGVVNLDRTRTLDVTFSRFYEGINTLPGYARDVAGYYDHLKAPVRVVEKAANGQPAAVYVESGPDHFAHAENYCTVASMEIPVKRAGTWGRSKKG